ncbi:MAG: NUDIX hydrolase [Gammaproteobacteria bacterium]|nr:NUDIX hydrolase [Gammaproteobacteria bacterium]
MHRQELLEMLDQYKTSLITEAGYVQQTRQFIAAHEDCFHSELLPGHVTGSAWVINQYINKVLMLHHKKHDEWFQPGGHADRDSDIIRVAIRETSEETGIDYTDIKLVSPDIFDVDIHLIPESQYGPRHYHYDIRFLLQIDDSIVIPGNPESYDIQWVELYKTQQFNKNLSTYRMMQKTRRLKK